MIILVLFHIVAVFNFTNEFYEVDEDAGPVDVIIQLIENSLTFDIQVTVETLFGIATGT